MGQHKLPEGVRVLARRPSLLRQAGFAIFDQPGGGYLVLAHGCDGRRYQQQARTWREACEVAAHALGAIVNEVCDLAGAPPPLVGPALE